jgi:MtrB/PioB family decaheme-associated outer membrane protein
MTARTSVAVVRAGIAALAFAAYAIAPTPAAAQDAKPAGTAEVGVGDVGQGSYKAGEYNGLQKQGAFFVANLDLRSGAAYNSASALRWRIKGVDLGLESRSLTAQVGVQGRFRLKFGYDELRRNRSDSYQTPYNGAGTNVLTLPGAWLVPTVAGSNNTNPTSARGLVKAIGDAPYISTVAASNGAVVSPTLAQMALVDAAADADVPLFHHVNLSTTRTRYDVGFNYIFDPRWLVDVNFRPEHKDGLKPMGTVSRNSGADISTVIADLIDTNHNQINLSLAFKGKQGFAQAGYYGSFFTNHVPFMSWQNWAVAAGTVNTISSAPNSHFNQVSGTGGVTFSPTTKLVASGSYARGTQNDLFITNATTPVVPVSSLNGLVVSTAFTAKLTAKPVKRVNLSAGYKYDNRDNRTAVHIFQYADAEEAATVSANFPGGPNNPLGAVLAQNANANRPYSKQANQFNADADLSVAKGQWIKGGYDFERINRSCPGSWIDCADAATINENTVRVEWRATVGGSLNARAGYAYSVRRADYNENAFLALVPYANVSPAAATDGATALSFMKANGWNGWGPALGFAVTTGNMNLFFPSNNALANAMYANLNRISELPGMRRDYVADRNRDKVRTMLTWQASEPLSFQAGVDFNRNTYPNSIYGVQHARNWAVNVDGTYALTDQLSANVFYTYDTQRAITAGNTYTANSNTAAGTNGQPGVVGLSGNSGCDSYTTLQQRNNNNKLDPCLNWSANMLGRVNTVGGGLTKKAGKLDLTSSLMLSRARWDNNVTGGNWANNILNGAGAAPTTIAAWFIPAIPLPTVTTNTVELRLNGTYTISEGQSVRVAYAYLRMDNADWMYQGMQFGSLSAQLPTSEQPFHYRVHLVSVSYLLSF